MPKIDDKEVTTLITEHIKALRNIDVLRGSYIVFCAEDNLSQMAGFLASIVRRFDRYILLSRTGDDRYGWRTRCVKDKQDYLRAAESAFARRQVTFLKKWICANPFNEQENSKESTLKKFAKQMKRYCEYEKTNSTTGKRTRQVSGTLDDNGNFIHNIKDDIAFVFTLGCHLLDLLGAKSIPSVPYGLIFPDLKRKRA